MVFLVCFVLFFLRGRLFCLVLIVLVWFGLVCLLVLFGSFGEGPGAGAGAFSHDVLLCMFFSRSFGPFGGWAVFLHVCSLGGGWCFNTLFVLVFFSFVFLGGCVFGVV